MGIRVERERREDRKKIMSKRKIEEQRKKGDGKLIEGGKREKREMGDERERETGRNERN